MSKVWFTSDTHFGSQRTLELSKRPFNSVEEMDKEIIRRWNEVVDKEDTIFHLGDFGDFGIAKKLNGHIKLICGNYDMNEFGCSTENHISNLHAKEMDYDLLKKVCDTCSDLESKGGFTRVFYACSESLPLKHETISERIFGIHEPIYKKESEFTLFGHIHKLQMVKKNGLNVGTDCHNFYPIDLDTVLFYKNGIDNVFREDVFCE